MNAMERFEERHDAMLSRLIEQINSSETAANALDEGDKDGQNAREDEKQ